MTNDELKMIIEKHEKWLKNQEGGERADLRGADLLGAKLYGLFQCHTLMSEVLQRCFGSSNVQLIDRQAALEIAMCYCPDDDGSCSKAGHDIREMLDEIEALPAADEADYYGEICEAIENVKAVNCWIPCSERLPKYDTEVLTYSPLHGVNVIISQHFKILGVTHWQPLPEPPKGVEANDGSN